MLITEKIFLDNIPALVWGKSSLRLFLAVHGNMSSKSDVPIQILAEEATAQGYQVLSFDLPEHGDRKDDPYPCKVQNCVADLGKVMAYAKGKWESVSLFANSMGAYFSLLSYSEELLQQGLFLSPVVDMERIIKNMMEWFDVSEERLAQEKEIPTPMGQTLSWDYYRYVLDHPVTKWSVPTSILYGGKDELCEGEIVRAFADKFGCELQISESSEHYFHTEDDLGALRSWIKRFVSGGSIAEK